MSINKFRFLLALHTFIVMDIMQRLFVNLIYVYMAIKICSIARLYAKSGDTKNKLN